MIPSPLRIAAILGSAVLVTAPAVAGSVSGSVRVLEKGSERPHESFADAVAWLAGPSTPAPSAPITVSQRKKRFRPRVLPVVKGQVVHFTNQDKLDHNVFSTTPIESFDLGRYPKGEYRSVTFDHPGFVEVYCNIHKQMILDVVVLENRYFGVTDDEGVFAIDDVPPGDYELNVWHIYGGTHRQPITVTTDPVVLDPITVSSTKVIRDVTEHLNKHGKRYPRHKGRGYPLRR